MSDEFANYTNIKMNSATGVGVVEYGGGVRGQFAMFYLRPVHNPAKSAEQGCPIYEDKIYVRISPPGERLNIIDRPATSQDRQIWALQYAQFQQNLEQTPEGTPIEQLFPDKPSIAAALRASGIHTIQQCAEMSADAIGNLMGGQTYCNAAQKYLTDAKDGAGSVQLRRELEAKDRDIRVLQGQVETLKQEVGRIKSTQAGQQVTMSKDELQALIAGAATRPSYPQGETPAPVFDAATAQINATSSRAQRGRPRKQG